MKSQPTPEKTKVNGDIDLKGGFSTNDRRLDRIPEFDRRNMMFNVAPLVEDKPLRSRSHTSKVWLDQGREGACVSFSFHQEAGAAPKAVRGLTDALARDRYYEMQRRDEGPGGAYPGASPRYDGTSVLAGAKIMQELGYFKEYRWAFNIDDVLRAISHEGPVVFGIPWLDSMYDTDSEGRLDISGRVAGGHAIMARGLTLPNRYGVATVTWPSGRRSRIKSGEPLIRFRNTWSTDWGIDGEALLTASDAEKLAFGSGWGEVCVPVDRAVPR
jgi:hypothetical protein